MWREENLNTAIKQLLEKKVDQSKVDDLLSGPFKDVRNKYISVLEQGREIYEQDRLLYSLCRPERLLELAGLPGHGVYDDPALGDVPVDILTTHDSTGGNSGSPVINGRGELVGCLFDGNYEAMTSDFLFMDDLTRSISVDIRYVLFIADQVDDAQNVLEELGVK